MLANDPANEIYQAGVLIKGDLVKEVLDNLPSGSAFTDQDLNVWEVLAPGVIQKPGWIPLNVTEALQWFSSYYGTSADHSLDEILLIRVSPFETKERRHNWGGS